jgi:hypothetical protein
MSGEKMAIKCAENKKMPQNIKLRKIAKKIMRYGIRSTQFKTSKLSLIRLKTVFSSLIEVIWRREIIATYTIKYVYTTIIYTVSNNYYEFN